jgi:hypothetical protein
MPDMRITALSPDLGVVRSAGRLLRDPCSRAIAAPLPDALSVLRPSAVRRARRSSTFVPFSP